jgi:predicted transcriptional regulator
MIEAPETIHEQLLTFFKAMADANRLKIVGLLAQKPHSVEELAGILNLRSSTVSHHLGRLSQAGLVSARAESYYSIYQLDRSALEQAARTILSMESLPAAAGQVDSGAYERKVLGAFLQKDGSLKTIPAQRKKLEVVLRYIVRSFDFGKRYPEQEVNQILSAFHEDTASLRRELVGYQMLARAGGEYWRPEQ